MQNDSDEIAPISPDLESTHQLINRWSLVLYWFLLGSFLIEEYAIVTDQIGNFIPYSSLMFTALVYSAHKRQSRLAVVLVLIGSVLALVIFVAIQIIQMRNTLNESGGAYYYLEQLHLIAMVLTVVSLYPTFRLLQGTIKFHRQSESKIVLYNVVHLMVMTALYVPIVFQIALWPIFAINDNKLLEESIVFTTVLGIIWLVSWQKLPWTRDHPVVQHKDSTKIYSLLNSVDGLDPQGSNLEFMRKSDDDRLIISPLGLMGRKYEIPDSQKDDFYDWIRKKVKKANRIILLAIVPLSIILSTIILDFELWRNSVAMIGIVIVVLTAIAMQGKRTRRLFLEQFPDAKKVDSSEVNFRYYPKYYFAAMIPIPWGGGVIIAIASIWMIWSVYVHISAGACWDYYVIGLSAALIGWFGIWTFVARHRFKAEYGLPLSREAIEKVTPLT